MLGWQEAAPPVAQAVLPVPVATSRFFPHHYLAIHLPDCSAGLQLAETRCVPGIQISEQRVINIRGTQPKMAPPHKTDREMFETETIWKTR